MGYTRGQILGSPIEMVGYPWVAQPVMVYLSTDSHPSK